MLTNLSEPAKCEVQCSSITSLFCSQKAPAIEEILPGEQSALVQGVDDFFHLKLDNRMTLISVSMMLHEKRSSFIVAVCSNEPPFS